MVYCFNADAYGNVGMTSTTIPPMNRQECLLNDLISIEVKLKSKKFLLHFILCC